jgi:hypothetical protein
MYKRLIPVDWEPRWTSGVITRVHDSYIPNEIDSSMAEIGTIYWIIEAKSSVGTRNELDFNRDIVGPLKRKILVLYQYSQTEMADHTL